MEITVRKELITPERAQQLLETLDPKQRRQRVAHIKYLRAEIDHGRWKINGETIKISSEGRVIDGQHRLSAIVSSGKAVESLVVFGIDENAFDSIDTGMRRNAADVLTMRGEANAAVLASAIGICAAVDAEQYWAVMKRLRSPIETEQYLDRNKRIRDSAAAASKNYVKLIHPSLVTAIHYIYMKRGADAEVLNRFVAGLKEGFVPMRESNFHRFREKLVANATSLAKVRRNVVLAWAFITLNATLAGHKLMRLEWNPKMEDFPTPTVLK